MPRLQRLHWNGTIRGRGVLLLGGISPALTGPLVLSPQEVSWSDFWGLVGGALLTARAGGSVRLKGATSNSQTIQLSVDHEARGSTQDQREARPTVSELAHPKPKERAARAGATMRLRIA